MRKLKLGGIATILVSAICLFCSCRQRTPITPIDNTQSSSTIANYKAIEVKENANFVYKEGATGNIVPGYSRFRISLETASETNKKVKLTEFTGEIFNGNFEMNKTGTIEKLVLSGLNPKPSNTDGTIEYEIVSKTERILLIKSIQSNPKTGNSINEYKLEKIL